MTDEEWEAPERPEDGLCLGCGARLSPVLWRPRHKRHAHYRPMWLKPPDRCDACKAPTCDGYRGDTGGDDD